MGINASRALAVAAVVLGLTGPAAADAPDIVYVATDADAARVELGVIVGFAEAGRKVVVDHQGELWSVEVAFGPAGKFAMLAEAATIGGKTLKKYKADTVAIAWGDLDHGVTGITAGDTTCVQAKCYEARPRFSPDGKYLYTDSLVSGGTTSSRYTTGKGKPKRVFDTKKRLGIVDYPQISDDGKTVAFVRGEQSVYVEKLPYSKKAKPAFTGNYIVEMLRTADHLFLKRREPVEQATYTLEAVDARAKGQTTSELLFTFSGGATWPNPGMLHDPGKNILYVIDTPRPTRKKDVYTKGQLVAVSVADKTHTDLAQDIIRLLDISDDGSTLLVLGLRTPENTVSPQGNDKNPEQLGLLDTATGTVQWLAIPGAPRVVSAQFKP